MLKRHYISTLIVVRQRCTFFALLLLIICTQHVSAQSQLAQDAYAIFEQKCFNCHGPEGAYRDVLLMEHDELIEGGTVVPENPDDSELYKRLLGNTVNGAQMPFNQPQLPSQSIETIRRWILAGAPDWAATPVTESPFIPFDEVFNTIESHLMSLAPFDRAFARYLTLTHLYNAGERVELLREYRKALAKLINSLSWGIEVTNPKPIDSQQTIFYIDLRHYEWDVNDGWTKIEDVYPYHITFDAPAQTALREQLERLQSEMNCVMPSVHIDWFLATASSPPLYHDLLSLPLTDSELETLLEVNVERNLVNAPGVRVWRAGFNNSGVSNNNRVVERHTSRYGAYWKSYDFATSTGTKNIFTHPLNFTRDGGEMIFNLPNGLQAYLIVDAFGVRLDEAPINIVSNPAASDPTVRNGISCFGCHTEGMNKFEDQVRSAIESHANPPYDKAQALRLYVEKSDMDALLEEDINHYRDALEATGGRFGEVEPISRFHEVFQGPVDAKYAAAVVGLGTETFLQKVRENMVLQNLGLLALDSENGSVKRDAWRSSFQDVLNVLEGGEPSDVTPPRPDEILGAHVNIPDPNLRTAIAETLGKSADAPITVEEMKKLTILSVANKGVRDLTGMQHATNLTKLWLNLNGISDISSLSGLTDLIYLELSANKISDISGLTRLTKLEFLQLQLNGISDILPLAGLTGLNRLNLGFNSISDVSPLAGLTNLEWLGVNNNQITDPSPLAGLTNLKWLGVYNNEITDLSPLTGLQENITLIWHGNPAFPTDAPKIEGPWLWVTIPDTKLLSDTDSLSEASGDKVTEGEIRHLSKIDLHIGLTQFSL